MEAQLSLYEVIIKKNMGIGDAEVGVRETHTFYFEDMGDVTFSQRLVERFEHGFGAHGKDFQIVSVKNMGSVSRTDDWKKYHEN